MRKLPGVSAIGSTHVLSAFQDTAGIPVVDIPPPDAPRALNQFADGTTPATSAAPIAVPFPTNLMLITPLPLIGAGWGAGVGTGVGGGVGIAPTVVIPTPDTKPFGGALVAPASDPCASNC